MPPIGLLLGGVDFKNLELVLKKAGVSAAGEALPAVTLRYGLFINTVIDFLIVAFTIFVVIKAINRLAHRCPQIKHHGFALALVPELSEEATVSVFCDTLIMAFDGVEWSPASR